MRRVGWRLDQVDSGSYWQTRGGSDEKRVALKDQDMRLSFLQTITDEVVVQYDAE